MKRFFVRTIMYALVFIVLANGIAFVLNYSLSKSIFYKPLFIKNGIKDKVLDYIILGSSRGSTTIYSEQLNEAMGANGLNLSMDATGIKSHLLTLKLFFESGHKAKNCILSLDEKEFEKSKASLSRNDYRFTPFNQYDFVQEHFAQYEQNTVKVLTYSRYFPMGAYAYYNLELTYPALFSLYTKNKRHRFDKGGNFTYPNKRRNNKKIEAREVNNATISNEIINEFIELTKRNDCKLIIYIAPYESTTQHIAKNNFENIEIINHSDVVKEKKYFFDNIHVNSNGRQIATDSFKVAFEQIMKK